MSECLSPPEEFGKDITKECSFSKRIILCNPRGNPFQKTPSYAVEPKNPAYQPLTCVQVSIVVIWGGSYNCYNPL